MIMSSNMDCEGSQDTIAELQPFAPAVTFGGGSGSATDYGQCTEQTTVGKANTQHSAD